MFYQENAPLSLSRGESLRGSAPPRFQDGDHRDVWCSEASRRSHRDAQRTARALLAEPASASLVLLPNMAQSVNITELNLPQLEMLKNQLDQVGTGPRDTPFPPRIPPSQAYSLAPIPSHFGRLSFPDETPLGPSTRRSRAVPPSRRPLL